MKLSSPRLSSLLCCIATGIFGLLGLLPVPLGAQVAGETSPIPGWVSALTLEEKASLVTGQNAWQTRGIPRLGIEPAWMADGPVGLRKSDGIEVSESLPATCFPSASAMSATFDPGLIERLGAALGTEARLRDVDLLLAPGLNLKRHPLGGRNFEYYSEDPLLSGKIAAAFVRGVQAQGVGATLKHFAVNNQEHRRMTIDARVDERTMRELYLRGFEIAVKEAQPQAVMSAYNRVNGVYASEHPRLLNEILREEWGFEGLVVSDWGAVDDPAASVAAGLDLEMPGNPLSPPLIVEAVRSGALAEDDLDRAAARVLQLVVRQRAQAPVEAGVVDSDLATAHAENHALAAEVAAASMVLLRNQDDMLPLSAERGEKLGVVGRNAFSPRIQGIGSSQIHTTHVDVPFEELAARGGAHGLAVMAWRIAYAEGGLTAEQSTAFSEWLTTVDQLVVFVGQEASHNAEAWDRPSMELASGDLELVAAARAAGKPMAVVVGAGGAVELAGLGAEAVLFTWLGGQAFGGAVARVLLGEEDPGGRLSETFASVADHPSDLNFPAGPREVIYGERLAVGYRYFQGSSGREPQFPFGHGLSYTRFDYRSARAPERLTDAGGALSVQVEVANVGERDGRETVQVYVRSLDPSHERADRELVAFAKAEIRAGESHTFDIAVPAERFAHFDDFHGRWVVNSGRYELLVGASATDIRHVLPFRIESGTAPRRIFAVDDVIDDIVGDPRGMALVDGLLERIGQRPLSERPADDFFGAIFRNMPFKKLSAFSGGALSLEALQALLELANSDLDPEQVKAMLREQAATPH
ncbi:MAG: glycoside hydrolase family 3 N-terminal domain-containing protein [Acidobacteriota bacterium]